MARKTHQVEVRLVAEYIKATYPQFRSIMGVPLGKVSETLMAEVGYEKAIRLSRPSRPEVDAVVFLPRYIVVIEAKVWHLVDGAAKLPLYRSLIPFTPELREYQNSEILLELVTPWTNPNLEIMCRDAEIHLHVFKPDWINEVVRRTMDYHTAEYRAQREKILRDRELLGLE